MSYTQYESRNKNRRNKKDKKAEYEKNIRMIREIVDNDYISNLFETWKTTINGVDHVMNSNISPEECVFVYEIVIATKPQHIFEFGMANGMSTMILLDALNKVEGSKLVSNDPFQNGDKPGHWKGVGLYNASQVMKNVEHVHTEKLSTDDFSEFENESFDIILVDGAHDKENVILDIMNAKRMLKTNGILILDDVLHSGVHEAMTEVIYNDTNYVKIELPPNQKTNNYKNVRNPATMHAYKKIN